MSLKLYNFEEGPNIGSGGQAKLVEAIPRSHDPTLLKKYVIRIAKDKNVDEEENTAREYKFIQENLQILNSCPYIVRIEDLSFDSNVAKYLLPRYDTDLEEWLKSKGNSSLSLKELCTIISQVTNALVYLRNGNIFHGDVKPKNVLILLNENICVLTDFGFSRQIVNTTTMSAFGTENYFPPELIREMKGSIKGDIWSTGITLLTLFCKEEPKTLWTKNQLEVDHEVQKLLENKEYGEEFRLLIQLMLRVNREQRLTPSDIHSVIDNYFKMGDESKFFKEMETTLRKKLLTFPRASVYTGPFKEVMEEFLKSNDFQCMNCGETRKGIEYEGDITSLFHCPCCNWVFTRPTPQELASILSGKIERNGEHCPLTWYETFKGTKLVISAVFKMLSK